jgi:polysaccharide deacetylase 2 family uncharacterized protein YibQ
MRAIKIKFEVSRLVACLSLLIFLQTSFATEQVKQYKTLLTNQSTGSSVKAGKLAIIIDDIGAKASDSNAFALPQKVTFSILPHTEFSNTFSNWSSQQNREVMLHMPMESLHQVNLGESPLLSNMYPHEIRNTLQKALQTVPHAVGVNNHMGSKLTQMTLQMTSFMQVLEQSNLFFIDSRTTRFTKATLIAQRQGVKTASRHVFLDHVQTPAFLKQQFTLAVKRAQKNGKAILIGHPYPITLSFLQSELEKLPTNVVLVTVSDYLQETNKFRINPN